jgi:hypothetical protein
MFCEGLEHMANRKYLIAGLVSVGCLTAVSAASASMITGNVDISGTSSVTATSISFYQNPATGCSDATGALLPCFLVNNVPATTGSFVPDAGKSGLIKNLTSPGATVAKFMTFPVSNVFFDLVSTPLAGMPGCSTVNQTAPGVTCVPDGAGPNTSPFRLTNGPSVGGGAAGSVAVQFSVIVNGYKTDSASGITPYSGIFTTQLSGKTIADVLAALAANEGTGAIVHSYSASFSPIPAPEPTSLALMGFGLLGLTMAGRKFARRRS